MFIVSHILIYYHYRLGIMLYNKNVSLCRNILFAKHVKINWNVLICNVEHDTNYYYGYRSHEISWRKSNC